MLSVTKKLLNVVRNLKLSKLDNAEATSMTYMKSQDRKPQMPRPKLDNAEATSMTYMKSQD